MNRKWHVVPDPSDPEMFAVESCIEREGYNVKYYVAYNLPIEDATTIAAAPLMHEAIEVALRSVVRNYNRELEISDEAHIMLRAALHAAKGGEDNVG